MEEKNALLEIRDQLDVIDRQITELYKKRMDLCEQVATYKIKTGKAVFDPEREAQKIETVQSYLHTDFDRKAIRELYQQMMTISRRRQFCILSAHGKTFHADFQKLKALPKEGKRVVYQGVEGAYAHLAACQCFGAETAFTHVKTWKDAMDAVMQDEADYAVLPIENSSHGAVSDIFDLLVRYPSLCIVEEVDLHVAHALMSVEGACMEKLQRIYSHPQALGQCSAFLEAHPNITAVPVLNTAVAATYVRDQKDPTIAALASELSAELYGLQILKRNVNQEKSNTTRFIVVGREKIYTEDARKISICFETAHKPGALYNALGNFIFNDVNMMMIESRPIPEKPFEYRFFIDLEGNLSMPNMINALAGLEDQITSLRILGNYGKEL